MFSESDVGFEGAGKEWSAEHFQKYPIFQEQSAPNLEGFPCLISNIRKMIPDKIRHTNSGFIKG
jgi:hypothetical protein